MKILFLFQFFFFQLILPFYCSGFDLWYIFDWRFSERLSLALSLKKCAVDYFVDTLSCLFLI